MKMACSGPFGVAATPSRTTAVWWSSSRTSSRTLGRPWCRRLSAPGSWWWAPGPSRPKGRTRWPGGHGSLLPSWIVCRKRPVVARAGWDRRVLEEMRKNITAQLREFWDAGIRGPDFVWAATGPALEAYSRHPIVRITDAPGRQLAVAEFLRHVRRMVVGFVVSRLLNPDGAPADELDDVTTCYLLHRNDFRFAADFRAAPASSTPCPAISRTRTSRGSLDILARGGKRQAHAGR